MSLSTSAVSDEMAWKAVPPAGYLRRYCQYATTQTDASVAFQVGVGLTILASIVPREVSLFNNGKTQYLNLYTMLVGDSVMSRKTTSVELGLTVAGDLLKDHIVQSPDSWQGLLNALNANEDKRALVVEPEFSRFLSQSSGGGYLQNLKLGYTEIYDGGTSGRTTKDAVLRVDNAYVTLLAGVAPVHIESHMTLDDFTGGFWARFMVIQADAGAYKPHNEERASEREWMQRLTTFYATQTPPEWQRHVGVSPEAKARIGAWGEKTNAYARRLGATDGRRGVIGRSQLIVKKLSALLAYDRMMWRLWNASTQPGVRSRIIAEGIVIQEGDVIYAEAAAGIHINSAIRVSLSVANGPNMRARRRVLEAAQASADAVSEGFLARQAQLLLKELRPILETLEAEGLLTRIPGPDPTAVRYVASQSEQEAIDYRRAIEEPPDILANAPVPTDIPMPIPKMAVSDKGDVVFHGGE